MQFVNYKLNYGKDDKCGTTFLLKIPKFDRYSEKEEL